MAINILTTKSVDSAKPGRHHDGDGLYLLVKPSGSKSWVLRMQSALIHNGKRKDYGLGSARNISLADVRVKAAQYRQWIFAGLNPKAEIAKEQKPVPTFKVAAIARHEQYKGGFKNPKHAAQWFQTLETYAFPKIGNLQVDYVDAPDLARVLSPIWLEKPETASRVRQRMGKVLDFAQAQGWREKDAPMRHLKELLPEQKVARREKYGHHAALQYQDMPELMARLRDAEPTMGRLALEFQILTAARSGEVRFARWSEINGGEWSIPASKMKAGVEHTFYLSDTALNVLERVRAFQLRSLDDLIFVGLKNGPLSDATISKALKLLADGLRVIDGDSPTTHGNRTSFRMWVQEKCPTVPEAVVELSLSHKQTDAVRAAYARSKLEAMRIDVIERWAGYVMGQSNNVVRIAS
jgi:integrase